MSSLFTTSIPHFQLKLNSMVGQPIRILIVEDSPTDAFILIRSLNDGLSTPFQCETVETLEEARIRLQNSRIGLVITDLNLPDSSGLHTFQRLSEVADDTPIVILSGLEDVELATESVRRGAQDYAVKGVASDLLSRIVRFAIERSLRIKAERERDQVTRELEIARQIQQSLYPANGVNLPDFDIAGAVFSADQACGDYYDFFPLTNGKYAIALGDVCGHGLPAALMMMQVRACLRLLASQGAAPHDVLSGVNEATLHDDEDQRRFASLFYAELDPASRSLVYASAGHVGYLLRPDGTTRELEPTGLVLGVMSNVRFSEDIRLEIHHEEIVFVPTDGFHEAANGKRERFGQPKMLKTLHASRTSQSGEIIETLYRQVQDFASNKKQNDDMAAVSIKMT